MRAHDDVVEAQPPGEPSQLGRQLLCRPVRGVLLGEGSRDEEHAVGPGNRRKHRFELAAVGRYAWKLPWVCECFLLCPLWKSVFDGDGTMVNGDTFLSGRSALERSVRRGAGFGREKLWRELELEVPFEFA